MPNQESAGHLDPATRRRLERDFDDLRGEFNPLLGDDVVERCLEESLGGLATRARLTTFVPLLVHRYARQQLRALAQSEGVLAKDVPEVLFVCVHDAGRSQMAAALLERFAADSVHIRTAGTHPLAELNPNVVAVMQAHGLNLSRAYAKPLTDTVLTAADVVVTIGCPDAVPTDSRRRRLDWDVPDPEGKDQTEIAAICGLLDEYVNELLSDLRRT